MRNRRMRPLNCASTFVAGVDLHAVKAPAVHRDHRALHVNQVVFAHSDSKLSASHSWLWGVTSP